jgi:riboflavin synthase
MFTGIIEQLGVIEAIESNDTNLTLTIQSALAPELKVDQSLSHNGVCLTVEATTEDKYKVTAIEETLKKTTIGLWKKGDTINVERCLRFDGRLDGHIVQGHVDTVGTCIGYKEKNGSWEYVIEIDKKFATLIIEKGSIALNGISLTIFNITNTTFTVAIIPYTYKHTNMHTLALGDKVNVEFDVVGKYVGRMKELNKSSFHQ